MCEKGLLEISNVEDRVTVASILFKNGYKVMPDRIKHNGKSYKYYVAYEKTQSTNSVEIGGK